MREPQPVLFIGASDDDAAAVLEALTASGRSVREVRANDESAKQAMQSEPKAFVLIDLRGTTRGPKAWRELLDEQQPGKPLVVLTDDAHQTELVDWLRHGTDDWLQRPFFPAAHAVLTRLEHQATQRALQREREMRLQEATVGLVHLARSPRFHGDDLPAALREITEVATSSLDVARCGVWLCNEAKTQLQLVDLYDTETKAHSEGHELSLTLHPHYFAALAAHQVLAVAEATAEENTFDFAQAYFKEQRIASTLDAGLRLRGELVGVICIEHRGAPRRWAQDEIVFARALAEVVSHSLEGAERNRAERALAQSERRFRDLFTYSSDAIVLYRVSLDGHVFCEDVNPAAELQTGLKRNDIVGLQPSDVLDPISAAKLNARYAEVIRAKVPISYEHDLIFPTGVRFMNTCAVPLLDDQGRVNRIASIVRDMTAQRQAEALQHRLEAQVAEVQKNEALGRLASHIAHDVNNLLTVITAHASRIEGSGRTAEAARSILQATSRGRELTQQILTFGRRRPPERKPLDLAELVRETLKLLEPTAPGVALREDIAPKPTRVLGDASQLHQVLTNLCTNALNAMHAQGTLTVSLGLFEVDQLFAAKHPPLQAGSWVRLAVKDTGVGMDEATTRRIFEPFFSTRPEGRGTGLGLAVVNSIVVAHDGAILVESKPQQGSTFSVFLKAYDDDLARPGAGQHLMLVDDHPGMARVSAKLLETLGYRTTVFDDPREALSAFTATPSGFDAVLTDLSMPQMSGEEFTRSLRALRPTLPVIVSSGMASQLDAEELKSLGVAGVLLKPWRLEEAVATLQRVLPSLPPRR